MALGKTVFAEPLNLLEAVFRKDRIITARDHASDHLLLELVDGPVVAEGRHRAAQSVGFLGGEFRRLDGDAHRLLLEQRHAQRPPQDVLQFIPVAAFRVGIFDRLGRQLPPPQIRMHHVALDRPRPHDGDLDDEVVERARTKPRQHVHLRPALDLEHAEGFAFLQHLIDVIVVLRLDVGQLITPSLVLRDQVEALADAGQHAERQHVDLHHPHGIDIVLVPFDEGAVFHRGIADRHIGVEPVLGQHIAADMLRQMTRKADQLGREPHRAGDRRVAGLEPGLPHLLVVEAVTPVPPHGVGQRRGHVLGQAQRLADIADRAARPVMDHGGDDRGTMAAVAAIDILHHLLAAAVLEIDVDVRRLQPLLGDETLEQDIDLRRVHRGDAEHVADGRVRRRATPLAQDVLPPRPPHDVMHGEEVMRVVQLRDQVQLLAQDGAELVVDALRKISADARPCQVLQVLLRGPARRHRLVGIAVLELIERERDTAREAHGLHDRLRRIAEQPRHLAGGFQVALGIGLQPPARPVDRGLLADAGQHILQGAPFGMMIEHLVGGDERHARGGRDALKTGQPPRIVAAMEQARREPDAAGPALPQPREQPERLRRLETMRQGEGEKLAVAEIHQVAEAEMAFALRGGALAAGQELAQAAIGIAVARIGENVRRAVVEHQPRPDQQPGPARELGIAEFAVGAHHPGQRVAVGDADRRQPQLAGPMHVVLRVRAAAQEREIGGDADLGIGWRGHANTPCRNQRNVATSRPWMPSR